MFRTLSIAILAFVVLGTTQVDAQLFRRLRKAAQQQRQSDYNLQRQNQAAQLERQRLAQQQNRTRPSTRPGTEPGRTGATPPTQSRSPRFSILIDPRTGQMFRRLVSPNPNQRPVSSETAKGKKPAPPVIAQRPNAVGQVDIARQATKQTGAPSLNGPTKNPKVKKDANVVRAANSEFAPGTTPTRLQPEKSFSILEPETSGSTEPGKPKPATSVLELNGPDKSK